MSARRKKVQIEEAQKEGDTLNNEAEDDLSRAGNSERGETPGTNLDDSISPLK